MGSDVDALFKLPIGEFTSARNALVARLKKAGQNTEAAQAKALTKPSASAWVVNQLYWRHGYLFGRLFEAGERLRHAQTSQEPGASTRELVNTRREVLAALTTIGADILREGGYNDTRDVMRRVTTTLEALSAYGSLPGAPAVGRLTDDLEPPGFETLAALQPRREIPASIGRVDVREAKKPTSRVAKLDAARNRREERRLAAGAKSAVHKAELALRAARRQTERADARLKTAAEQARDSEGQRAELEKRFTRAVSEAERANEQARTAEADVREAAQAADAAERALQLARSRLEQLAGKQD